MSYISDLVKEREDVRCHNKFDCNDLVLKHAESRSFTNPHTGSPASKFGNAYYHTKQLCAIEMGASSAERHSHRGQCVLHAVSKSQRQSLFRVWSLAGPKRSY